MASKNAFRNLILNLHLWIGIASAILLLLAGVSGALLVFEAQIDRALNPKLARVTPASTTLSLTELKAALERQYPGSRVLAFDISDSDDASYGAYLLSPSGSGMNLAVDQHTGKTLGAWDDHRFTRQLHGFHTHLLAGEIGSAIVGWSAVILLFLCISGLFLWWRSKIFGINFQTSGPKFQYDLHSTVGVLSLVVMLAFAFTGIVVHWERPAQKWANQVSHVPTRIPLPQPDPPVPGALALDPSRLVAVAQAAVPAARVTALNLSDTAARPVLVIMKFPEDHTPAGRTRVFLDQYSGKVLAVNSSRAAPAAVSYVTRLNREIHTGDIGGWPTRIIAAVFSLALPLLAVSGPLLWWQRRRRA
ncbi:MAG TPA: PepSY-associated TM helix domain-containing protein [Candidatus Sulfotelmatobacter sp.]